MTAKEIPVNMAFTWGGKVLHIPSLYSCGKGLMMKLFVEIDPAGLRSFPKKWMARAGRLGAAALELFFST